jgi:hypothetical protein
MPHRRFRRKTLKRFRPKRRHRERAIPSRAISAAISAISSANSTSSRWLTAMITSINGRVISYALNAPRWVVALRIRPTAKPWNAPKAYSSSRPTFDNPTRLLRSASIWVARASSIRACCSSDTALHSFALGSLVASGPESFCHSSFARGDASAALSCRFRDSGSWIFPDFRIHSA